MEYTRGCLNSTLRELKLLYYRGLRECGNAREYLLDTCLSAQDNYKNLLDYFKIKY